MNRLPDSSRGPTPGPRPAVRPGGHRGAVALVVLLVAAALGGCGGNGMTYCGQLQADQKKFSEMFESGDPASLLENLPMLERDAKLAPEDLQDEWQTFLNAVRGLEDALHAAGVEPTDFHDGRPPAGLSVADQKSISDAADVLSSDEVVASASGIEQQARDVCKIQLGL